MMRFQTVHGLSTLVAAITLVGCGEVTGSPIAAAPHRAPNSVEPAFSERIIADFSLTGRALRVSEIRTATDAQLVGWALGRTDRPIGNVQITNSVPGNRLSEIHFAEISRPADTSGLCRRVVHRVQLWPASADEPEDGLVRFIDSGTTIFFYGQMRSDECRGEPHGFVSRDEEVALWGMSFLREFRRDVPLEQSCSSGPGLTDHCAQAPRALAAARDLVRADGGRCLPRSAEINRCVYVTVQSGGSWRVELHGSNVLSHVHLAYVGPEIVA